MNHRACYDQSFEAVIARFSSARTTPGCHAYPKDGGASGPAFAAVQPLSFGCRRSFSVPRRRRSFRDCRGGYEIEACVGQVEFGIDSLRIVICNVVRQLLRLDLVRTLESDGTLDRVFELANVAVPGIISRGSASPLARWSESCPA